ncbi:MAG: DUF4124 domain-containing protein [Desulfobacteraceae bacterium]|nr:MAG: DUF4124 domain-containing protein [Desulfobacteraceae bacterium]
MTKRILGLIIFFLAFILLPAISFSDYYQWQDEQGVWHFTNTPPPESTTFDTVETVETPPEPAAKPMQFIPHEPEDNQEDDFEDEDEQVVDNSSILEGRREFYLEVDKGAKIIETLQLEPKEKQRLSIQASKKTYVGYYTDIPNEDMRRCGYCIKLKQEGIRASVESPSGGQDLFPRNGTISFFIENLASFPVAVEVYRQ